MTNSSDSPAIFFVVYKNSTRMTTLVIGEFSNNTAARKYKKKMIRKGIYTKDELDLWVREIRFGEGIYV